MSDHQFEEREFEGGEEVSLNVVGLVEFILGGGLGHEQIQELLNGLPRLTEEDLTRLGHGNSDITCPICITPLPAIIAEEEMALVMESPAHVFEEMGVTRLWMESREESKRGCGHLFCRRCISKWIAGGHDSCPMCRRLLIPPSEGASITPEPATTQSNVAEEAAFRQLQRQMRTPRAMLEGRNRLETPGGMGQEDGESASHLRDLSGADIFEEGREDQGGDRNEYVGMYS